GTESSQWPFRSLIGKAGGSNSTIGSWKLLQQCPPAFHSSLVVTFTPLPKVACIAAAASILARILLSLSCRGRLAPETEGGLRRSAASGPRRRGILRWKRT